MAMIHWDAVAKRLGYSDEGRMWYDLYHIRKMPMSALATKFDVCQATIRTSILRCGVPTRRRGGPNRKPDARWPSDEELLAAVERDGTAAVATRLGFTYSSVYKRVRTLKEKI